ncbi:MAG TPA: anaerobic glycerol-3-phosphate dehydrogenase subunit GlpA [Candidatus Limnocylindrales bacterium]|nr:anaerobic glycerol-3-phosphate dehydrogenase subunit GlpA [Candidatus Limnocylindrales bacterium]
MSGPGPVSPPPGPLVVDALVIGGGATGAGVLRDLARRGLRTLLVEKGDLGTGTSGRYHGLLHSGGRYVVTDPVAAHECIVENRIVRRIAPACVEDTGGFFVATPEDPDDYADGFAAACAAAGIPTDEVSVPSLRGREPALNPGLKRAFRVPDAVVEPWQLIEANVDDARSRGGEAWPYHRVVAMRRSGGRILQVDVADVRSGSVRFVAPRIVVSAAGAWAGIVAGLAGANLEMSPGKGTMLIFNQRMTDTVINRLKRPGDGDIMVPVHSVAILGTTEEEVDDPDVYGIRRAEVLELLAEGEKLFPGLSRMRLLRAYAGVRPLYREEPPASAPDAGAAPEDGRAISRAHVVIDHGPRDGVDNLVSIVGGKLTTYRLMAKQTADAVVRKLGLDAPCTTADDVLPNQGDGRTYWLGHRLAEHEADGGGDADLVCECELVTRRALDRFLDERWPCSLDDVRRGTRLGMGPCQGGFCTFRAAGILAERSAAGEGSVSAAALDGVLTDFLAERYHGVEPIAWGRQLQELWLTTGIYAGVLGLESLPVPAPDAMLPALRGEATDAVG